MASRWKVGDEVTYALMAAFYQSYPADGRALALARAQRAMLASTAVSTGAGARGVIPSGALLHTESKEMPFSAPWSWAAFSLVGRWD